MASGHMLNAKLCGLEIYKSPAANVSPVSLATLDRMSSRSLDLDRKSALFYTVCVADGGLGSHFTIITGPDARPFSTILSSRYHISKDTPLGQSLRLAVEQLLLLRAPKYTA
ncbi:hypothetical protein HYQ44_019729 [Verticillium longisporum]|nr:hypothetical protein HYQ44_019729 [Verticillium longisporum]